MGKNEARSLIVGEKRDGSFVFHFASKVRLFEQFEDKIKGDLGV